MPIVAATNKELVYDPVSHLCVVSRYRDESRLNEVGLDRHE